MESRAYDRHGSAPTAFDIVFAGASAVTGSTKRLNGAPTASDIVFAGASDVVAPSQRRIENAPTASDIVFAGATKVSEPRNSHIGAPTASDIVFAGATKVSGPLNQRDNAPDMADNSEAEGNLSETESGNEENEHEDDQKPMWDHDEIKGLFDLFDTDNDGYLTTNDLKAFVFIWGPHMLLDHDGNGNLLRKLGPNRRIDFANFLKLVTQLDIDLDNPLFVQEKFLDFVRTRIRGGFILGSALRKLVIRFHIHFTDKENKESNREKMYKSTKRLKTIFNAFDEDGDGYLTTKQVETFMRIWERQPTEVHNNIKNEVDIVWNGKIDFENFLDLLDPSDIDVVRRTEALKLVPLLNRIFSLLDEDGDDYISPKEVDSFRRIWKTDPDEVENFTDQVDFFGKENFDFPDFFNLFPLRLKSVYLKNLKEHPWSAGKLRYVFSLLDEDGDGCLSGEEVKSFTRVWSMRPNEAKFIIDKVEADKNEIFNYSEFLNLLPVFEEDRYMLVDSNPSWKPIQTELIVQLNYVFSSLDENGDGRLTPKEVESFMRVWRLHPSLVEEIVSTVYSNGRGTIDFPNFLKLLYSNDYSLEERTKDQWPSISNFLKIFIFLDEDGDGCLTSKEVETLTLIYMLQRLELKEIREILATVNANEKGKIDFPTLLNWLYPKHNQLSFRDNSGDLFVGFKDIFSIIDEDGDGRLTTKEVEIFARLWKLNPITIQDIKKEVDADWNGTIDLPHFFHWICGLRVWLSEKIEECELLIKKFQGVFSSFDEDKDGFLTSKEVETILQMGSSNPNEGGDLLSMTGAGGNGTFDFPNFFRLLYSTDINPGKIIEQNIETKDDETVTNATEDYETVTDATEDVETEDYETNGEDVEDDETVTDATEDVENEDYETNGEDVEDDSVGLMT